MHKNRIGILVAVLVVLTGIAWLSGLFGSEFSTLEVPEWELSADDVRSVEIRADTLTIAASLRDQGWMLTRPLETRGDSMQIRSLLNDLAGLELSSVVSTNPARHGTYGVDSTASMVLVGREEGDLSIFVGEQTPDFLGSFVRLSDDPRVFATSRPLRLPSDADRWRDKVIVDVPVMAITRAEVQFAGGGGYVADASAGEWRIEVDGASPAKADSAAVVRWIRRFAPLRGDGFLEDTAQESSPAGSVVMTAVGGTTVELEFFETESYLVIPRPEDGALLRVARGRKDSLLPGSDTLTS